MSDDYLVKKQTLFNDKKSMLNSLDIEIFLKGLTHDFGQKLKIASVCFRTKWALK